ncbi:hypothetical protein M413DRAFT_128343 [Hebeloma cylindrosporum]|uniref:Uncharacterized protein n=1 Tax=Hebeloma cylindrosporum TaxID=76867 RepID=A0A0C2YME4_HEBCY|nr:hypothetical protein M413DRAFT_128343 [Hebeloma cylindrosporum h7]
MLMSHESREGIMDTFFREFFKQLFSAFGTPEQGTPCLERISISNTLDAKSMYTFMGIPDHAALQPLTWCSIPSIIEEALAPYPKVLQNLEVCLLVKSIDVDGSVSEIAKEAVRTGVWKTFAQRDRFRIDFSPGKRVDGDEEGMRML